QRHDDSDGEQHRAREGVRIEWRRHHVLAVCAGVPGAVRTLIMPRRCWTAAWLALLLLSWGRSARAEKQVRAGVGINIAQSTTIGLRQPGESIGRISWGANTALIGNILGVEGDFSRRSGFIPSAQQGAGIVNGSSVTTLTGNVILTLPSHLVEYTLRPY